MLKHITRRSSLNNIQKNENEINAKNRRSRIPIPTNDWIPKRKTVEKSISLIPSLTTQNYSASLPPEISYGKDRTRLVSRKDGKRPTKSSMESEISTKYCKYKLEKTKLLKQQWNFRREYEEMKKLLENLKSIGVREVELPESETGNENGAGDMNDVFEKFQKSFEVSELCTFVQNDDLNSVPQNLITANAEIFNLLKELGEKVIQMYCHEAMGDDHDRPHDDLCLLQNIVKIKNQFYDAIIEGNNKFLECEKEIGQLKVQTEGLQEKLALAEQQLATKETANEANNVNREKSFMNIEEKLREIIEKLQCQFKAQKLIQEKTENDMDILRSKFLSTDSDNQTLSAELNACKDQLEDYEQTIDTLREKVSGCRKENEETIQKCEAQLMAAENRINQLENELIEKRNETETLDAMQIESKKNFVFQNF